MNRLIGLHILLSFFLAASYVAAADQALITGHIVVTKALTKKRVSIPNYDLRGATVEPAHPTKTEKGASPSVDELSRVIIYLEGAGLNPGTPEKVTLTQRNRQFEPEIVVIPVGSTVAFPNADPIFHNVFSLSKTKSFDLGYYPAGQSRSVKFDKPGVVQVFCHLHTDMSAMILVLETPYWTRPAADGSFSLPEVPAGTYDLVAWHRSAGAFRRHITLTGGQNLSVDFVIPIKDEVPGETRNAR